MDRWNNDQIQFARLLAEIYAVGLDDNQYNALCNSMGLTRDMINEILGRADMAFEHMKQDLLNNKDSP